MQELQEEFGPKGLVVVALSDEEPEKVEKYVDEMGLSIRVAAQSKAAGAYEIKGYPSTFLLSPDGEVVWEGHPSSLSSGKVKEALKGAKPTPKGAGFMAFSPTGEYPKALKSAISAAESGKLGKAISAARKVALNDKLGADVREAGEALATELTGYVELLTGQIEAYLSNKNVMPAIVAYEAMAKELKGLDAGKSISDRLREIEKDDDLQNELAGAEALARANELAAKRGKKVGDIISRRSDSQEPAEALAEA